MEYAAIKTKYGGVSFRSRLEAKWAAFFDLLDWSWDYEPIDLNGWIPDFVIRNGSSKRIFIEVKPYLQDDISKIKQTWEKICEKTDDAICLCGAELHRGDYPYASPRETQVLCLGLGRGEVTISELEASEVLGKSFALGEPSPDRLVRVWRRRVELPLAHIDADDEKYECDGCLSSWRVINGKDSYKDVFTNAFVSENDWACPYFIENIRKHKITNRLLDLWREAGNIVQWKK